MQVYVRDTLVMRAQPHTLFLYVEQRTPEQLTIRLNADFADQLRRLADSECRTPTGQVKHWLSSLRNDSSESRSAQQTTATGAGA